MASTTAKCPLLRKLPRELRDLVYDLVAEDQARPVLRIEIEQHATTRHKTPMISAFSAGLSGACSQLRHEFSDALVHHIELLMTRSHGRRGGPTYPHLLLTTGLQIHAFQTHAFPPHDCWIHMSASPHIPHTTLEQKFHALATFIPIESSVSSIEDHVTMLRNTGIPTNLAYLSHLAVIFVTDKSEALPDRRSIRVPRQPFISSNLAAQRLHQSSPTVSSSLQPDSSSIDPPKLCPEFP
jgi:hypothetical protein